jgi:hypothetical protein
VKRVIEDYVNNFLNQVANSIQMTIDDFDVRRDGGLYLLNRQRSIQFAISHLHHKHVPLDMAGKCKIYQPAPLWKTYLRQKLRIASQDRCVFNKVNYAFHAALSTGTVQANQMMNPHPHPLVPSTVCLDGTCQECFDKFPVGIFILDCINVYCDYSLCGGCWKARIESLVANGEDPDRDRTTEEQNDVMTEFNAGNGSAQSKCCDVV